MEKIRKIVREILKEAFEFRNDAKSFVPPISVKNIAQQAQQVSQQRKTPLTSIDGNVNEGSGENISFSENGTFIFNVVDEYLKVFSTEERKYVLNIKS
jgi:hypothetical protein